MDEQLVIMTYYEEASVMDVQNRRLQALLDEGWRIVSVTPGGGGGSSGAHSVVFVLERKANAAHRASKKATVRAPSPDHVPAGGPFLSAR